VTNSSILEMLYVTRYFEAETDQIEDSAGAALSNCVRRRAE
jgi:hypothetical protein